MVRWGLGVWLLVAGCGGLRAQIAAAVALPDATSASKTFHDSSYKVSFDYPADWVLARKDGEISTFRLDARTATRATNLRAVASIPENPFPASTFSGAYFYLSVTPHSSDALCARQAVPAAAHERTAVKQFGGVSYVHGHDEQKNICTTARDEVYTTFRRGACYRFDLAMNNFCGGEVSGVKDVTQTELDTVRDRMESILKTVRFDGK